MSYEGLQKRGNYEYYKRIMIGDNVSSEKSNFIWNMLGGGIYSALQ